MKSGVYFIKGPSGKMYIGSAIDTAKRINAHLARLRSRKHSSKRLQGAWSKCGGKGFSTGVLELCRDDELAVREQHWISRYSPAYNVHVEVRSPTDIAAARVRMSVARKAYLAKPGVVDAVREKSLATWQDPEIAARRIAGMKWDSDKKARVSAKMKNKDRSALVKARRVRWSTPGERERQSEMMKAVRAAKAPRTTDDLIAMAEDRLLTCLKITGARRKDRMILHCDNHGYTADKAVGDFLNGQGCRLCGFERSSAKQKGVSVSQRNWRAP